MLKNWLVVSMMMGHLMLPAETEIKGSDISPFSYGLTPILSHEEIINEIDLFSKILERDYSGEELCILAVLKGSLWFVTDLMQVLHIRVQLQTISCHSYQETTSGELTINGIEHLHLQGKHVLVIDDICDTGQTLSKLTESLRKLNPKSLKSAVLLSKRVRKPEDYQPDYSLFELDNLFVVGYGLDYQQYYRGLPGIYILEKNQ